MKQYPLLIRTGIVLFITNASLTVYREEETQKIIRNILIGEETMIAW